MGDLTEAPGPYAASARDYLAKRWSPLPLPPGEKSPPPDGFTGAEGLDPTPEEVEAWIASQGAGNVALRLPKGVVGIDVDAYDGKRGLETLAALEEVHGPLPPTAMTTARRDGSGIRFYRVPVDLSTKGELGPGIDVIQRVHRYAMGPPSLHPSTGRRYRWVRWRGPRDGAFLTEIPSEDSLPELPSPWVEALRGAAPAQKAELADPEVEKLADEWATHGDACQAVQSALAEASAALVSGEGRHYVARDYQLRLVRLGERGHHGVRKALTGLRTHFKGATRTSPGRDAGKEWTRALQGAVRIVAADPSPGELKGCRCVQAEEGTEKVEPPEEVEHTPEELAVQGPTLYRELRDYIERHFYLGEPWHYVVAALMVFLARLALVLPGVFYLTVGGPKGSGKTAFLALMARLTRGLMFENVSEAALARSMEDGRTVLLDEVDVARGKERDAVRDSMLRQGYRKGCAPYARWDATKKTREDVQIYGPKIFTYRATLDEALEDRAFHLPAVKPRGPEGYAYVLASMWPEDGNDLVGRLDAWGKAAVEAFPEDRLRAVAHEASFAVKVAEAAVEIGANRESELLTLALLTAEVVGVDVASELKAAAAMRQAIGAEGTAEEVAELAEIALALAGPVQAALEDALPHVRLVQVDLKREMNRRRKERGELPVRDRRFAALRRELEVKDDWLRNHAGRLVWVLPESFVRELRQGVAHMAHMGNIESDSNMGHVSHVGLGAPGRGARVLHEGIGGRCTFCKAEGDDLLVVLPWGALPEASRSACRPCAEDRFDLGPPP